MKSFFLNYYKWELNTDFWAGGYFATMLSIYCIEIFINNERSVDIFIMLEMFIVCYVIAIVQRFLFTEDGIYSEKSLIIRTILWFAFPILLVTISSIEFKWFISMQPWCMPTFILFMVTCFLAVWIGIHIANKVDTKNLNIMLKKYKEKGAIRND